MKINIRLESDLHVGSGLSNGVVDSDYLRDKDENPYIPGAALKGVLEDLSTEILGFLGLPCCNENLNQDSTVALPYRACSCLRCQVFGRAPDPGGVIFNDLKLTAGKSKGITTAHTSINPCTGTASKGKLYSYAHAASGSELSGLLEDSGLSVSTREAANSLLKLAICHMKAIGGLRRRGKGRVTARPDEWWNLSPDELQVRITETINRLKDFGKGTGDGGSPEAAQASPARVPVLLALNESDDVIAMDLEFVAEAAIALPDGPPAGNQFGTLDHIPSGAVAGLIMGRLRSHGFSPGFIEDLIKSRAISFSPLIQKTDRASAYPWPLSLERCKKARGERGFQTADGEKKHLARNGLGHRASLCDCGGAPGPLAGHVLSIATDGTVASHRQAARTLNLHNSIDFTSQSVSEKAGLFGQEVLPSGTRFGGRIFCSSPDLADLIGELMKGRVSFGKARSRGYGRGTMEVTRAAGEDALPGSETRLKLAAEGEHFSIMLISPAILLNDDLSSRAKPSGEDIQIGAGAVAIFAELADGPGCGFSRFFHLHGFNSFKGLPELPETALVPGSIFRFQWNREASDPGFRREILARLERLGIGENRELGFGRVICNPLPECLTARDEESLFFNLSETPPLQRVKCLLDDGERNARSWALAFVRANQTLLGDLPSYSQLRNLASESNQDQFAKTLAKEADRDQNQARWEIRVTGQDGTGLSFEEYVKKFATEHGHANLRALADVFKNHRQDKTKPSGKGNL